MFLRFHRLPEDGFAPRVLFLHGARGVFHVVKHARFHRRSVRDDAAGFHVYLQQRATAGTSDLKIIRIALGGTLRHFANDTAKTFDPVSG